MKIVSELLGELSITQYGVGLIFCLIGFIIRRGYKVTTGVTSSTNGTPTTFNIKFFLLSHYKKIGSLFTSILLACVIFRFSEGLIGSKFSYLLALGIGFGWDKVDDILHKLDFTELSKYKSNSNSNPTE